LKEEINRLTEEMIEDVSEASVTSMALAIVGEARDIQMRLDKTYAHFSGKI